MPYDKEAGIPLFAVRVKRWGNSLCFVLPRNLREDLHIGEGDIIAIRLKPPYGHFCVWPMNRLAPLEDVSVDELPPLNPHKVRRA